MAPDNTDSGWDLPCTTRSSLHMPQSPSHEACAEPCRSTHQVTKTAVHPGFLLFASFASFMSFVVHPAYAVPRSRGLLTTKLTKNTKVGLGSDNLPPFFVDFVSFVVHPAIPVPRSSAYSASSASHSLAGGMERWNGGVMEGTDRMTHRRVRRDRRDRQGHNPRPISASLCVLRVLCGESFWPLPERTSREPNP
jgi:hypothetical protein